MRPCLCRPRERPRVRTRRRLVPGVPVCARRWSWATKRWGWRPASRRVASGPASRVLVRGVPDQASSRSASSSSFAGRCDRRTLTPARRGSSDGDTDAHAHRASSKLTSCSATSGTSLCRYSCHSSASNARPATPPPRIGRRRRRSAWRLRRRRVGRDRCQRRKPAGSTPREDALGGASESVTCRLAKRRTSDTPLLVRIAQRHDQAAIRRQDTACALRRSSTQTRCRPTTHCACHARRQPAKPRRNACERTTSGLRNRSLSRNGTTTR